MRRRTTVRHGVLWLSLLSASGSALQAQSAAPSHREGVHRAVLDYVEGFYEDNVIFDVQDQTASAKLTAWWGTDYLLLARYDGRWMIREVLWQTPPPARRP